jgi:hypothetical protein
MYWTGLKCVSFTEKPKYMKKVIKKMSCCDIIGLGCVSFQAKNALAYYFKISFITFDYGGAFSSQTIFIKGRSTVLQGAAQQTFFSLQNKLECLSVASVPE